MAKELKDTLNLPQTEFPMRADLVKREPKRIEHWESTDLYRRIQEQNHKGEKFLLHDGPPFTNGDVHIGTALNKILKDFILRYKSMRGLRTPYVPGWDCHGLPIEHKVAMNLREAGRQTSTLELRQECDRFSESFIERQRSQFRRLGILTDWSCEYRTKDPAYEADILRTLAGFIRQGRVFRSKKPVYWSIPCETALAEAEIEYKEHRSDSVWVRFPITESAPNLPGEGDLSVIIWTTTPWTLPANLAVAVHPDLEYSLISVNGERFLLATGCLEATAGTCGWKDVEILGTFRGRELEAWKAHHPFIDRPSPFVLADYVTTDSGSGCVHTAPGHGLEDYQTGLRYELEIYCPVADDGSYIDDGKVPDSLIGISVLETKGRCPANAKVLELLRAKNSLVHHEDYNHSYPHCWRSKTPVIFRAVDQWFINLDHDGLKDEALQAISQVKWVPAAGENRIRDAVTHRPDWCISRQRAWGVPIPAFFDDEGEAWLDADVVEAIADKVAKRGTDLWFEEEAESILKGIQLPTDWPSSSLRKGRDTLDVWIDSGSSHLAVLAKNPELGWPADVYLEGSDQHRGWFQSSLWTSVVNRGAAPYRQVLTHGFIVGQDGKKISKSDGKPQTADSYVNKYGVDVIRLWLASEEFRKDIPISDEILDNISKSYRLIRNTLRFQLSNLYDYEESRDAVPLDQLSPLDRWALHELSALSARVTTHYENYQFHLVAKDCIQFCSGFLSAVYHDILKDRLYTLHPDSPLRRSSQTVIHRMFETLNRLLSPILLFTSDEAWSFFRSGKEYGEHSVHLESWPTIPAEWSQPELAREMQQLMELREEVNDALEQLRKSKVIGQSLEDDLTFHVQSGSASHSLLSAHLERLPELFIVSRVHLNEDKTDDSMSISTQRATGHRCPRCWRYVDELIETSQFGPLCSRCRDAVLS